jgi:PAS domain S-box-containing protein
VQERTAALTRSEQDLRTIFNNVYDSIYIHDLDGTILDVNDRALELHGATREQLVGASVADISSPDAPVSELSDIFQRVQQGETLQFEWVGRRFDNGHTFDVEVSLRQVTLDQQTVVIAGVRDISDRKRAAQELQAERFRLQLALDAADMGTWSCQLAPQQLQWSVKAEEIFGFQRGTFSGDRDTFIEMIHPEDRDRVLHAIEQTFETGAPYQIEYRIGRLDGESRWVAVWGMISPSTESAEQQQLIGVVADITDRKQAELDLRESRNMLELVLNAIPQRVFWKDRHSVYRGGNLAYANDYQLTAADINGKVDTDFFSAEQAQLYAEEDQRILSGISRKLDYEEQLDITTGEQRWLQTSKVPLTNSQGEVVGVLGCYDDISDRKRAEAALHDSEERLRLALMASNQGLYDLDLITGEAIVSPTYVTMLGYNPANFHETNAKWLTAPAPRRSRAGRQCLSSVCGWRDARLQSGISPTHAGRYL